MNYTKIFGHVCIIFLVVILGNGCKENNQKNEITKIVQEWKDKEIIFPTNLIFTKHGRDTMDYEIPLSTYKILMYVDSVGCTSCKLQLHKWKEFIDEVDSLTSGTVPVLFFFHPKDLREISYLLRRDGIDIPVCIDTNDYLNAANNFPSLQEFQTFLLNDKNQVLYIGNPVQNVRIKEMYLKEISNNTYHTSSAQSSRNTQITTEKTEFDLGTIQKGNAKTVTVSIKNTGEFPFVIFDTRASCGCTHIAYEKKPVVPDSTTEISITYNADDSGHFNKTVSVYGNMDNSPLIIRLKGNILEK